MPLVLLRKREDKLHEQLRNVFAQTLLTVFIGVGGFGVGFPSLTYA